LRFACLLRQQTKKIPRIGYLSPFSPASEPSKLIFEAFHQGLRELGWIPGKNVSIEYRWAEEKYDRLPGLRRSSSISM
jgi:putative ABC transport system substrate-binding protein